MTLLQNINFRKARLTLGLSLVCAGAYIAPALAQNYDTYDSYGGGGMSQSVVNDAASTEIRIQQFESQISAMTGKIEEQSYQIRQLQEKIDKLMGDLSMRVDDLEKNRGGSGISSTGGFSNTGTTPSTGNDRSMMENGSENGAANTTGDGYQWNSTRENTGTAGQLGTMSESGGGDSAAVQYENAFASLKSGDYASAEKGFKSFISGNPDHVLAGNAKYWLGETYYVRGDFQNAARTFAEGFQKYPKSSKAPDNLLKLGMSLASLNKKTDACVALGQIETQYANGAGPVLNRAKQEMTRLGC